MTHDPRQPHTLLRALHWAEQGTRNAIEVARLGRLTARHGESYEVVERERIFKLRHYAPRAQARVEGSAPLLLVPPLMLTAEIYDVAPGNSAVAFLVHQGVDVWVVDFGAPEQEDGGMERTLDDHVRAVATAVGRVRAATGQDVHLAGYSQGGMFCYQAAAYLRAEGLHSVITFGSPVDIHQIIPMVGEDTAREILRVLRLVIGYPLDHVRGLPGVLTSSAFKLLSFRKELHQLIEFLSKLNDRQALEQREQRRRFLAGEGFVAWPGPALRKFVDEFIVHNRMASGGFVIDGRTITLADISCPILAFVGLRDDIARPASVRAVRQAAINAEAFTVPLHAGHFGLVVGSTANRETWPTVIEWLKWRAGAGPCPELLEDPHTPTAAPQSEVEDLAFTEPLDVELFYDTAADAARELWSKLEGKTRTLGAAVDNLRWQAPRLARLERLSQDAKIGPGRSLSEQARRIPEQTFFLWRGRAFSYREANTRVNHVVKGLIASGVTPSQLVGVVMQGRPSFLSAVTALSRLGAVAVIIDPGLPPDVLRDALALVPLTHVLTDPDSAARVRDAHGRDVLVLGGGGEERQLGPGIIDLERIDPALIALPRWYQENPGRARELALVFVSFAQGRGLRAARITNGRWAFSALGAAAAATLTPKDTVYCCLPLHHPSGLMVTVGGALTGGARLALATRFSTQDFWPEVRRYGATVVFYAGTLGRWLVNTPPGPADHVHPLRLFAGSGARLDDWHRLMERFAPVAVLEFYASTEANVVLVNASGAKVGALGKELPGSAELTLVRVDFTQRAPVRDAEGKLQRCAPEEPGLLLARVDDAHPAPPPRLDRHGKKLPSAVLESVFEPGDEWYLSGDVLRQDTQGDYWFVDRLSDIVVLGAQWVSPRLVEDALYQLPGVAFAAAYAAHLSDAAEPVLCAALTLREGAALEAAALTERLVARLQPHERPSVVRFLTEMPFNDGLRILKGVLSQQDQTREGAAPPLHYDAATQRYRDRP